MVTSSVDDNGQMVDVCKINRSTLKTLSVGFFSVRISVFDKIFVMSVEHYEPRGAKPKRNAKKKNNFDIKIKIRHWKRNLYKFLFLEKKKKIGNSVRKINEWIKKKLKQIQFFKTNITIIPYSKLFKYPNLKNIL